MQQLSLTHIISLFNELKYVTKDLQTHHPSSAGSIDPHALIQLNQIHHQVPTDASKYTGAAAFIDPHYILIELTEIHHYRPSKTPSFLSRFNKKVKGIGACHINGRNYYLPEQTRSHEFAQGPHTLVRNLDLDFMEMNILLNKFSANKKHISDLRQL